MKKTMTEAKGIALTYAPAQQQNAQQQNNRSFLSSDLLLGIIAALVLISGGGMLISLLDLDVYGIVLFLGALLFTGGCVLFASYPQYRKWIVIGASVIFVLLFVFGGKDGFALFFNSIKDLYGMALSRIYLPYAVSDGCNEPLAATLFLLMITMVFAVIVTYMLFMKSKVIFCFVFLFLPFLLIPAATSPHWLWYILLVISLTLSICAGISGGSVNSGAISVWVTSTALIGAALVFTGLFALGGGFEKPALFEKWKMSIAEDFNELRYGRDKTNNFPEGDFRELDSFVFSDDVALEITMTEPESLYLRGYVGSVYSESGWSMMDKSALYDYSNLFYSLHQNGFYGTSQISSAALAVGMVGDPITVTVKNINAKREYIYTPYELIDAESGNSPYRIGDVAPKTADYDDPAVVTYTMLPNQVRDAGKLAEALGNEVKGGDETVLAYLENETAYREFVYASYLELPEKTKTVLESHFDAPDFSDGHESYDDVIQKIYDVLLAETTYNEECGKIPPDAEFLQYFLENSTEGYSVHYATAAALIFRYYGIPARYVEGYVVTPEDVSAAAGNTIAIDGGNAHAWVEYYRDGVGWIPLETTPPYLFIMEQPDEIQSLVSDTLDPNSSQSGMVQMEEDNFEDIEEDEKEPPKESSTSPWLIVSAVFAGILLLLVAAVIVLILRRRKALAQREQMICDAEPRLAVDLLFCHCLELLFAAGIEKQNGSLDQYAPIIRKENRDLGIHYAMFCDLHRETRFSDHPVLEDRKKVFYLFRNEVESFVRSRTGVIKQLIHKYIYHLY
ncbi:MAG: hypothetical protein IKV45_01735 [Firmicutes bacterium]|nr:hypothetical protein [Bacillota bacterium]